MIITNVNNRKNYYVQDEKNSAKANDMTTHTDQYLRRDAKNLLVIKYIHTCTFTS